jgi:O-methyltransferase domain
MPTSGHVADPVQGFSPAGQLLHLISGYWVTQAIFVATELGIPDLLGRKPRAVDELALLTHSHGPSLYRVLRALASVGIFSETPTGEFVQSPMGTLLRADMPGNLAAFSRFQGDDWHWSAWGSVVDSVRTGKSAMSLKHQSPHCFDYLSRNKASSDLFNAAMGGYAAQAHAAVVDAYDFTGVDLIMDIGGGHGTLLSTILEHVPSARGLLMDRAEVLEGAPAVFAQFGVTHRCQAVPGDFFKSIPAAGDVYILSSILHDWADVDALMLLRNLRAALHPKAKVLIVEHIVPDGNESHPAKFIDLEMTLITGGRERTAREYAKLLDGADLSVTRIIPTAAAVSIIEARVAT